jgi:hypothetical protein
LMPAGRTPQSPENKRTDLGHNVAIQYLCQ